MDTFDRIATLLQNNHMTQADLARATGISTGLISQWKKRAQNPSTDKLQLIADFFHVTVDYLLTGTKKETPAETGEREIGFDDFTYAMYHETNELTESDKELLLGMAKQLREARKRKDEERR